MWIDTHSHVNFKAFESDWKEIVERAVAAGVEKMIVVGADLESSKRAVEMAEQSKHLWASVGIHPHHARDITIIKNIKIIEKLAKYPRVVAIGEIGLDYHLYKNSKYEIRNSKQEWEEIKKIQKELFEMQLQVAQEMDKPVIIHSREAGEEVLESIKVSKHKGIKGVFHCFGGSKKYLKKILAAGFYVGFTGQITYVPDRAMVAREVPPERLLLETDCPYMPPFREGRRSEPRDVTIIGQFLGEDLEPATTANARELFGI